MCATCFAQPSHTQLNMQSQHPSQQTHPLHPSHYPKLGSSHPLPSLDALHALHAPMPMGMHEAESDDALSLPSLPSQPISSRGVSQTSNSSVTVASPVTATAVAVNAQPVQAVRVAAPVAAAGSKPGRKGAAAKMAPAVPPPLRPTRIRKSTKRSESDSDDGGSDEEFAAYPRAHHARVAPQMATIASHHVHQAVMATAGGTLATPVVARAVSAGATGSPLLVARAVSASPSTARRGLGTSQQPPPGVVLAVQIPVPPGVVPPQQAKVLSAPPPGGLGSPALAGAVGRRSSLKQQPSPLGALVLPPRKNSMTDITSGGGAAESPASASRSVRGGARASVVVGTRGGGGGAVPASPRTPRGRALAAVATASPIITASPVPQHAQLLRDSLHLARVIHSSSPTVTALSSSGSTSPTVSSASSPKKRSLNAAYSSSMGSGSVGSVSSFDSGGSPKPPSRAYHASPRQPPFDFATAVAANTAANAAAGGFAMPAPVPPLHAGSQQQQQHSAAQQALLHARFSALASQTSGGSSVSSNPLTHSSVLSSNDDPLSLSGGKALEVGTPPQLSLGHFTPPSPISPLPVHFQSLMDRQDGLHAAAVAAQHAPQGGVHGDADTDPDSEHPPYPGHHKLARAGSPSGVFGVYRAVSSHDDDDGSFSTAQYLHSDLHGDDDSASVSVMTPLQNTRNVSTGSSSAATTALPETPRTQALSHLMSHTGLAAGGGLLTSNTLLSWEGKDAVTGSSSAGVAHSSAISWARRATDSQLAPPSLLDYGSSPNPPLVGASSSSMLSGSLASSSSLTAPALHASPAGVPAFSSAAGPSSVFAVSPSHGSMVAPPLPRRALQLHREEDDHHASRGDSPLFMPLHSGHQRTTDPFGMDMELHL